MNDEVERNELTQPDDSAATARVESEPSSAPVESELSGDASSQPDSTPSPEGAGLEDTQQQPVGETAEGASHTRDPDEDQTHASDDTVMEGEPEVSAGSEAVEDGLDEIDDEPEEAEPEPAPAGPIEIDVPEEEEIKLDWYILKVQSNRERSISEALRRKIAIEGLDQYFGEVKVPTEKVTEFKGGKKKIVERKLWPGYIAVEMHVNDDTWFAIRETSGIGDFTGSGGQPTPMDPAEVAKFQHTEEEETEEAPKLDIKFNPGDKVKVMEGNFENFEGEVSSIDEAHGRVTVMLSIFGRPTPVELEYWQVESV